MSDEVQRGPVVDEDDAEIDYAEQEGMVLLGEAEALRVTDQESYRAAGAFRIVLRKHMNRITDLFGPMKKITHAAHKKVVEQENRLLAGPRHADQAVAKIMLEYDAEQRRKKALAEARAAEEAKREGTTVPAQQVEIPQAEGIAVVTRYYARITSPIELLKAIVLEPDMLYLINLEPSDVMQSMARQQKETLKIPGVSVVAERGTRVSA